MGAKNKEDTRDRLTRAALWMELGERLAWEARATMCLVSGLTPVQTAEIMGCEVPALSDVRQCMDKHDPPPAMLAIREELVALARPKRGDTESPKLCRQISESVVAK